MNILLYATNHLIAIDHKLSEWKRGSIDLNLLMNSCPFRLRKAEYSL